ncbi:hypothetical protein [Flavobacterium columnare]|uniref:hypothetical protein n=1 Tax=Flavobacterium columnare TaxID=996 RepID=UPI000F50426A|nr:hypothetical protein [Flavobacterium columnare]
MSFLTLSSFASNAQSIDLESPVRDITNQIGRIFPLIAGAGLIVIALWRIKDFTNEGGDWKKGLTVILVYCIIMGMIVGLYKFLTGLSL